MVLPKSACISLVRSEGAFLACHFAASDSFGIVWAPAKGQALTVENCLLAAGSPIGIDFGRAGAGRGEAALHLARSTLRTKAAMRILSPGGLRHPGQPLIRVAAERNVFDADYLLTFVNTTETVEKQRDMPRGYMTRRIRGRMSWSGRDNVYRSSMSWISLTSRNQPISNVLSGPQSLD
jgi:hypothetical protein